MHASAELSGYEFVRDSLHLTTYALAAPSGSASDCVPGTRHFGSERRNSLIGPSFKEWNFAVYKTTEISQSGSRCNSALTSSIC